MNKLTLQILSVLICLLFFVACSDDDSDSETDVRGTWDALFRFEVEEEETESVRLVITLDQDDDLVFGTYSGDDGSGGNIEGTISDRSLTLFLTQAAPCDGEFELLATLADEEDGDGFQMFSGSFIGEDCTGELKGGITSERRSQ